MNLQRALTLVEVLLALALSAVVIAASTSWIQLGAHVAVENANVEEGAADAVLRLIQDDLQTFDRPQRKDNATSVPLWQERLEAEEHSLSIRTRESGLGPVVHRYVLHDGILTRETNTESGESSMQRMLMDGVESFICDIDAENEILVVWLTWRSHHSSAGDSSDSNSGIHTISRSFDLR